MSRVHTLTMASLLVSTIWSCKNESNMQPVLHQTTSMPENKTTSSAHIQQPDWAKNAVIYEVNVRQFSQEGTLDQVTAELPRIKKLGVDIVWLMPIHPIGELNRKGTLGSYYAVKDYKSVNPEFGTLQDLKELVTKAHSLGIKVIIDWVANHSSPDNVWVKDHLDYYTKDSLGNAPIPTVGTDWLDVADLNYDNPKMREAMQDAMAYWVQEADIDGFRCDVAGMVPLDFWIDTRKKLDKIKPVFMLAEGGEPELHEAFNMTYGWPFKDTIIGIADKKSSFKGISNYINAKNKLYTPNDLMMYFTSNHDENSWNYLEAEKFGKNRENFIALTYLMGGIPLIYNGQESGLEKKIEFFEKDPIPWGEYEYAGLYERLSSIFKANPAMWNNNGNGEYTFLVETKDALYFTLGKNNEKVLVLQNFSSTPQHFNFKDITGFNIEKDLLSNTVSKVSNKGIEIPAHSTLIFKSK